MNWRNLIGGPLTGLRAGILVGTATFMLVLTIISVSTMGLSFKSIFGNLPPALFLSFVCGGTSGAILGLLGGVLAGLLGNLLDLSVRMPCGLKANSVLAAILGSIGGLIAGIATSVVLYLLSFM